MAKKIGWGILAVILIMGVSGFAADTGYLGDLPKDLTTVLKGILSPQQISILMKFWRDHGKGFHGKGSERPDLFKAWKELNLSEEQQRQLLKISGDTVDKVHPYVMTMIATGTELTRKVIAGDPTDPSINELSAQFGKETGEMLWQMALVRGEARSLLTPDQIEILQQHRRQHDLLLKTRVDALPRMAEELAVLWSELNLTPSQMDGLSAVHRLMRTQRRNQHIRQHEEWKVDMEKILTPDQIRIAERFHDKQIAQGEAHFIKVSDERDRFCQDLGLTGEQKIGLLQIALEKRPRIVPSIQKIMNASADLRDQVHSDILDRKALMAAAAKLGDAIGQAAGVGAMFMNDAKEVLTTEQIELVREHMDSRIERHVEQVRIIPAKVHEVIELIDELGLTPEQKDLVVKVITQRHRDRRSNEHHGITKFF
jgi:Spy/CpxP family protein refolding chaperone